MNKITTLYRTRSHIESLFGAEHNVQFLCMFWACNKGAHLQFLLDRFISRFDGDPVVIEEIDFLMRIAIMKENR